MREVKFSDLFNLTPKQREAIESTSRFRYTLYGGARGGGKSYLVRAALIRSLLRWGAQGHSRVRVGLFCETYGTLADRQISKLVDLPAWLGRVTSNRDAGLHFALSPDYGGGMILLRNLDKPTKYKGVEMAAICVDELTMNHESTFDTLRGSLRWPGIDAECYFIGATNPDGPGRKWCKAYWLDHELPVNLKGSEGKFNFVPALPGDNPHLTASYWEELNTLPEALKRAWLFGAWDVMNEGAVYREFADANIVETEANPALPVYLFADDGYEDPRAFLFTQKWGDVCLVFAELYHTHHLAEDCINEACTLLAAAGLPRPAMMVGPSESKELQVRSMRANIPYRQNTHRILDGILQVRRLMLGADGGRRLLVHRRCKNLLAELRENYVYPPESVARRDSELPLDRDNHACDAMRYGVHLLFRRA